MNNSTKKFNIKNYFDFGLYKECLRQLSLVAFICFILINVVSVLIPISAFISELSTSINSDIDIIYEIAEDGTMCQVANTSKEIVKMTCDATEMCWYLFAIFVVVAPLLTLMAFNFLTKRNACDYFHAFPQKRGCIFNTYIASILTWLFVITLGSAAITSVTYICCNKYLVFSHPTLWTMSLSIFICSILVTVGVAIACSLTGTIFTNIVTSLLILFFPRLLIFLTITCLTSSSNLLVSDKFLPILDPTSNLIIAGFFDIDGSFMSALPIIYTLILSIIYFFLGRWLFGKRSSETAGNAAINRFLQCIFRLCIGLPLSFIVIYWVFDLIVSWNWNYIYPEDLFYIFVIELICIIAMLLFELLSTKKFKNLLRALPSILLFFAAQVVILIFSLALYTVEFNYSPAAGEIDYIIPGSVSYDEDYYSAKLSNCKIDNDEINKIISKSLENTIQNIRDRRSNQYYDSDNYIEYYGNYSVTVGIKSGLTVKYRRIRMTSSDYEKYISLLIDSEEVMQLYDTLPKYNDTTMDMWCGWLSEKEFLPIYNTLREEVAALDPEEWYNCMYMDDSTFTITLVAYVNNQYTYTRVPISPKTPKTLMMYMNAINDIAESNNDFEILKRCIEKYDGYDFFNNTYGDFSIYYTTSESESILTNYWDYYYITGDGTDADKIVDEYADKVKDLLKHVCDNGYKEITSPEVPEGCSLLHISFYDYYEGEEITYFTYIDNSAIEEYENMTKAEIFED